MAKEATSGSGRRGEAGFGMHAGGFSIMSRPLQCASLALQNIESRVKLPWKQGGLGSYLAKKQEKNVMEHSKGGKKEPSSGAFFPGKVCVAGDRSSCVDLAGVGVRKKRLIGIKDIKAYAVGVYFNPTDIRRADGGVRNEERAPATLDNVLVQNGKSIIRLVVVFPRATGKQISKSLGTRPSPFPPPAPAQETSEAK